MALHFTDLSLFKALVTSAGTYTEGSIHKCAPKPTVLTTGGNLIATLSATPQTVIEVVPKNGDALRRMEISTPYVPGPIPTRKELCDPTAAQPSFLTMKLDGNTVYGWIDDITSKVHSANQYSYVIDWHVDWWLTAGNLASYGSGRLLRGPETYARPDPSEPRLWKCKERLPINTSDPWVTVIYISKSKRLTTRYWQPGHTITIGIDSIHTLDWNEAYSGDIADDLELDPDDIVNAYVCPRRPGRAADPIFVNADRTCAAYEIGIGNIATMGASSWSIGNVTRATDDSTKYVITDPTGAILATLPWGLSFSSVHYSLDIGTNGGYISIRFADDVPHTTNKTGEGRVITVPLQTLPVTSDAWSSYNYSGERTYDKEMKRIQQEQTAANGIAGIGTGIIGGAIAGSMVAPGPGTIAGAAAGAISGVIGLGVGYSSTGNFNKREQAAVDRLKSNQASNVILTGNSNVWQNSEIMEGRWYIVALERDPVSAAELTAEHTEIGYITDTILADASTVISGKGPLQIQDLQVSGLNPEGNRYISAMFARGVHLD